MSTRDQRFSVEAYAAKTRSGLYAEQSDSKSLYTIDAFNLAGSAGKSHMNQWLQKIESTDDDQVASIFERIPKDFISSQASDFALKMLKINKKKLLG